MLCSSDLEFALDREAVTFVTIIVHLEAQSEGTEIVRLGQQVVVKQAAYPALAVFLAPEIR